MLFSFNITSLALFKSFLFFGNFHEAKLYYTHVQFIQPLSWRAIFQFLTTSAMMNIHIVFGLGLNMFISYLSSVNCFSHPYSIQPLNPYVEIKDIQPWNKPPLFSHQFLQCLRTLSPNFVFPFSPFSPFKSGKLK